MGWTRNCFDPGKMSQTNMLSTEEEKTSQISTKNISVNAFRHVSQSDY